MKRNTVLIDLVRFPVPLKLVKGRNIVVGISGNPVFVSPDVTMVELSSAIDTLEESFVVSLTGRREDTARMHRDEKVLDDLLRKEAKYVDRIADGDATIILSSGFNMSKQPVSPSTPEFSATAGEFPGSILLKRKAVKGACAYVWEKSVGGIPLNESEWVHAGASGNLTFLLLNLNSVTKYGLRCAPVMAQGTGAYCDPIVFVVA